jgi:hypothetical protein
MRPPVAAATMALVATVALLATAGAARAGAMADALRHSLTDYCSHGPHDADPERQDRLLRLSDRLRRELQAAGTPVALVSRSGLNLQRFGQRYSHAGFSLREGAGDRPWSVRQLYYACDEGRPRLFDQGLAGFVFGLDSADSGHVSLLLLPPGAATDALADTARDRPRALRLLAARYSANAYPFSTRYQNCNQWLVELLASAWGRLPEGPALRQQAQQWLAGAGYQPTAIAVPSQALMFAAGFMPLLHLDDHPDEDRFSLTLKVSLPEAIEGFMRTQLAGTRRVELCHAPGRIVLRRDGPPLDAACTAGEGDEVEDLT